MHLLINELKGTVLFILSCYLNFMAFIDQTTITFVLGTLSSLCVIAYYAIRIYRELKHKSDVGESK